VLGGAAGKNPKMLAVMALVPSVFKNIK